MWVYLYIILSELLHLLTFPFLLLLSISKWGRKEILPRLFPSSLKGEGILLHGASVGEIKSLIPLARELVKDGIPIFFTSATINGVKTAEREGFRASLLPFEFSLSQNLFFRGFKPSAIVISERDYWLRLIRNVKKRGGKVLIINFLMARKNFFKRLFIKTLLPFEPIFFLMTISDREFIIDAGFKPERVKLSPSLKVLLPSKREIKKEKRFILASSTHGKEHELLKEAFERIRKIRDIKLVVAPRYLREVKPLLNWFSSFKTSLFSQNQEDFEVLVIDRFGVLNLFYPFSLAVFVGGSIVKRGCHDLLEPCAWGIPVIFGPNYWNQKDIAEMLIKENGGRVIKDSEEIFKTLLSIMENEEGAPSGEKAFLVYKEVLHLAEKGLREMKEVLLKG